MLDAALPFLKRLRVEAIVIAVFALLVIVGGTVAYAAHKNALSSAIEAATAAGQLTGENRVKAAYEEKRLEFEAALAKQKAAALAAVEAQRKVDVEAEKLRADNLEAELAKLRKGKGAAGKSGKTAKAGTFWPKEVVREIQR